MLPAANCAVDAAGAGFAFLGSGAAGVDLFGGRGCDGCCLRYGLDGAFDD